jgi:hypothetical protein
MYVEDVDIYRQYVQVAVYTVDEKSLMMLNAGGKIRWRGYLPCLLLGRRCIGLVFDLQIAHRRGPLLI